MSSIRALTALLLIGAACLFAASGAAAKSLNAPGLQSPASNATVQSLPAFTWHGVRGAASYEFEFSADRSFSSGVSGFGQGPIRLDNTAITNTKTIPNGTYYWRARGDTAKDHPGRWSKTRVVHKQWSTAPSGLSPDGGTVSWPNQPLVLKWSPVPSAVNYNVYIATDPNLTNLVLGSLNSPEKVQGPQFAFPSALAPGTYYWAVQPVDAEGFRGARSAVSSFTWSWPSSTPVTETDDDADSTIVEPRFTWNQVPGAASYEIEISRAQDFPLGSDVLDQTGLIGNSFTPTKILPNETTLYWRLRARDARGDAGSWNVGQPFVESFDLATPTIQNLRVVNPSGDDQGLGSSRQDPILTWSPVPGASSYTVKLESGTRGLAATSATRRSRRRQRPPGPRSYMARAPAGSPPGGPARREGSRRSSPPGVPYCVNVSARRDDGSIVSATTQLGNVNEPAFRYVSPSAPSGALGQPQASTYSVPGPAGTTPTLATTPLISWNPIPGAASYFVAIARDQAFTNVVELGYTTTTSWAPPVSLVDETSAYFYEIIPVDSSDRVVAANTQNGGDLPQAFNKSSVPPTPVSPTNGATVQTQPTFEWLSALGARNYTLQISLDPSFANPIEQITTDATSYTANNTLPADKTLFWRVRANNNANTGLNWSAVRTFTHHLPAPAASAGNPTGGSSIPLLSWTPLLGAVSYNMLVTQANGSTKTFTFDAPQMTPTTFFGSGIWRWQVQAVYPGGAASGYFSPAASYLRTIPSPTGVHATKSGTRIVISWAPDSVAKQYQVQLSTTNGFASSVANTTTDNTVWVPQISADTAKQKLYWRVAAVDQGGNVGSYASGIFKAPPKPHKHKKHRKHKTHKKHSKHKKH